MKTSSFSVFFLYFYTPTKICHTSFDNFCLADTADLSALRFLLIIFQLRDKVALNCLIPPPEIRERATLLWRKNFSEFIISLSVKKIIIIQIIKFLSFRMGPLIPKKRNSIQGESVKRLRRMSTALDLPQKSPLIGMNKEKVQALSTPRENLIVNLNDGSELCHFTKPWLSHKKLRALDREQFGLMNNVSLDLYGRSLHSSYKFISNWFTLKNKLLILLTCWTLVHYLDFQN